MAVQDKMDKIVALCKNEVLFTPVLKYTAVWRTPGITAHWVSSLKIT